MHLSKLKKKIPHLSPSTLHLIKVELTDNLHFRLTGKLPQKRKKKKKKKNFFELFFFKSDEEMVFLVGKAVVHGLGPGLLGRWGAPVYQLHEIR